MIILYLLFFILGLVIGSFLNALIYRIEVEKSLSGRSFCPHCKKTIEWYDLVPLFSWIVLRGKCRNCKKKISVQYPLVELAMGLGFLFVFMKFFPSEISILEVSSLRILEFAVWSFFSACLVTIFVYDAKHQIIPDRVVLSGIVVAASYIIFESLSQNNFNIFTNYLLAAIFSAGFFLALALISKGRWMGGGDIKLVFFMGLALGVSGIIIALYVAFVLGSVVGLLLIVLGQKKYKSKIAFGPFLVIGTLISFFYSEKILEFYDKILIWR